MVMVLRTEMIAAVVEPVGRKANWSANERVGGEKEGRVNEVTDHCALHDSGQNWGDGDGTDISMLLRRKDFGIGWMLACFHCCGTVEVARERLKS